MYLSLSLSLVFFACKLVGLRCVPRLVSRTCLPSKSAPPDTPLSVTPPQTPAGSNKQTDETRQSRQIPLSFRSKLARAARPQGRAKCGSRPAAMSRRGRSAPFPFLRGGLSGDLSLSVHHLSGYLAIWLSTGGRECTGSLCTSRSSR